MKKNVLISGGSGFIGKYLTHLLVEKGFSVAVLSRSKRENTENISYYQWDVNKQYIDENSVINADYIVHLAGEGIADKPWTNKRKKVIVESREKSIELIYEALKKNDKKPEAFISASGIGIYGAVNGPLICNENTPSAKDFLGTTCQKWEAAADKIASLDIRTVKIRTGLVLGKDEGFLKKLVPIFKLKLGSALGSGKQYMPWIHIDDLCSIYFEAITNSKLVGPFNAAVFDNTTNTSFSKTLAKTYGYTLWLPNVPAFLLKLVLGEMSKIILTGRRVSSAQIEKLGFEFRFKNLKDALKDCLLE
ncbi:TIGR01777 family oxidoreductase [Flavobacterium eburneipallidum]|uniref:TIGR01777 family oxidoreductase n=1 Tax=Flavobacterium eburneipallidum TaxID=3003263 RepID=UPI0022AC8007|nr:TIGR01777 family oxidoreductase [Flavobacterium eburneipallidum]